MTSSESEIRIWCFPFVRLTGWSEVFAWKVGHPVNCVTIFTENFCPSLIIVFSVFFCLVVRLFLAAFLPFYERFTRLRSSRPVVRLVGTLSVDIILYRWAWFSKSLMIKHIMEHTTEIAQVAVNRYVWQLVWGYLLYLVTGSWIIPLPRLIYGDFMSFEATPSFRVTVPAALPSPPV